VHSEAGCRRQRSVIVLVMDGQETWAKPAQLTLAKEGLPDLMPGSTDEAMVSSVVVGV
jgi:hypothetical protein